MSEKAVLMGVGDLILDLPDPDKYFDEARATLRSGDVVIGQIEVPYCDHPQYSSFAATSAPASPTDRLEALPRAGFNVGTTAGNHSFDQGENGVVETLGKLRELGMVTAGTGRNLDEARLPGLIEKKGIRFAVFQYNCVGPMNSWASPCKAGAAFIRVNTFYVYEQEVMSITPQQIYSIAEPATLHRMKEDFDKVRGSVDVIVAAFHLGALGKPFLFQSQIDITHSAIDWGADIVLCHHSHALQGVEVYNGRPIFYSLGNFVTVSQALRRDGTGSKQRTFAPFIWPHVARGANTAEKGIVPYSTPEYPFNQDSRNTLIAKAEFTKDGIVSASMIPCWINDQSKPEPVKKDGLGTQVLDYVKWCNELQELNTEFEWNEEGTEIKIAGVGG